MHRFSGRIPVFSDRASLLTMAADGPKPKGGGAGGGVDGATKKRGAGSGIKSGPGAKSKGRGGSGASRSGGRGGKGKGEVLKGAWRLFNVDVPLSDDPGKDSVGTNPALLASVKEKLGLEVVPDESKVSCTHCQLPAFLCATFPLICLGRKAKDVKLASLLMSIWRPGPDSAQEL